MRKLSGKLLIAFVIATLAGACLHFLYVLLPNPVTAILAPVNESLWEHLKILYWPYLIAALFLNRGGEQGCLAPWMLSGLLISGAMLGLSWTYHIWLFGDHLSIDLGLYVLLMAVGFLLPGCLDRVREMHIFREVLFLITAIFIGMILLFTFLPPDHIFFADLSGVNTWSTIPY